MNNSMPPSSKTAEQVILGSLLRDSRCLVELASWLRIEHFYADAHQATYRTILEMYGRNEPIEAASLADALLQSKRLEDVGGYSYLAELLDAAPTAANVEHYSKRVQEFWLLRSLRNTCADLIRDIDNPTGSASELIQRADRTIAALAMDRVKREPIALKTSVAEVLETIDARARRGQSLSGISTGFVDLDRKTSGFQNSELIILAARTSVGKTALALNLIANVAQQGHAVFVASIEQAHQELTERLLCRESYVDSNAVRNAALTPEDGQKILKAGTALSRLGVFIDDAAFVTANDIALSARRLKVKHNIAFVAVDYLQIATADDRREQRHLQVGSISRRLKQIARELQIPVLALAQLGRGAEERAGGEPRLSDLRESGNIEQDADTVLLMHRDNKNPNLIQINVAKQRNGPTGRVMLSFDRQHQRFGDHLAGFSGFTEPGDE